MGLRQAEFIPQHVQRKCPARLQSSVKIHCGDHRLQCVSQQRILFPPLRKILTASQSQQRAEIHPTGRLRQRGFADEIRFQLGQRPFTQLGIQLRQVVADNEREHCIAEKLQPLVM